MKKKNFLLVIILATALVLVPAYFAAQRAQSAEALLGAALHQEEVEGNYEAAIETYKKLLAEYPDNRPMAARAQLRIGMCYEKLGLKEAPKAFQKVIENYPEQVEAVKMAKEKLSILQKAKVLVEKDEKEFKLSKIYTGEDYIDSISPDGQKLAIIRQNEIWVRDIAIGKEVSLTTGQNMNWNTLWSPDSQWIAFVDSDKNIKVVFLKGGPPRTLVSADQSLEKPEEMTPMSWSSNGRKVIFHVPSKGLFAVPAAGGDWEEILTFQNPKEARKYRSMILSPDGQWIAYTAVHKDNTDIYVMPSIGGESVRITSNPAVDRRPVWSYDGKWIAFASYRAGNPQIWIIRISSEGKPEGVPVQVTRETHILGGNWTKDGRIGFPTAFRTQHIFTANPDGSGETQLTQFPCGNYKPRWSPDGEKIAFRSDYLRSLNTFRLWAVLSKGGEPKLVLDQRVETFVWSPDGEKIIFIQEKAPNCSILMTVPAEGGDPEEISTIHGEVERLHLSPDGRSIAFTYSIRPSKYANSTEYIKKRLSGISTIPVDGGDPRTLIAADKEGLWYSCCRWSPDGRKIAFIHFDYEQDKKEGIGSIWTMDVDGREPKLITKGGEYILCWSLDGKEIIYESRIKGMDFELYKIRLEGGEPVKLNIQGRSPEFSPDGKRLTYSRWIGGGYEFWLAENFLK
jgi:Tol biopolymer transport system component